MSLFDLFMMSCLRSTDTGVTSTVIWVSSGEPDDSGHHQGPRLWVLLGDSLLPESLTDAVCVKLTSTADMLGPLPFEVAKDVASFVKENLAVLLSYWDGEISSRDMLDLLEPISS